MVRMGRMTALQKKAGGVPQQIRVPVEVATAPFQFALSTRAGGMAYALQTMTDANPHATILSVDGISAYDSISRVAMLRGLQQMEGGDALLPFVHGSPSTYVWETTKGVVHEITQGEGGEQGRPHASIVFTWTTQCVEAIQARLRLDEKLMAFLDDIYAKSNPNRSVTVFTAVRLCGAEMCLFPHRSDV